MFYNCSTQLKKFYHDKVDVSKDVQSMMKKRRQENRKKLKATLEAEIKVIGMAYQGSYTMGTMVQSRSGERNDIDIDDGIYFEEKEIQKHNLRPLALREKVKNAIDKRDNFNIKVKTSCVRIDYKAGYHEDIPAYKQIKENTHYQLASGNDWKESDPLAVTTWFNKAVKSKSPIKDNEQMRRIVQLVKYFSKKDENYKNNALSGFILSVLVEECYQAKEGRDDLSFYSTVYEIYHRLQNPKVYNPVLEIPEELTKDKSRAKVSFFRGKLKEAINNLSSLDNCTFEEAMDIWGKIFNEIECFRKFPDDRGGNNSSGSKSGMNQRPSDRESHFKRNGGKGYA